MNNYAYSLLVLFTGEFCGVVNSHELNPILPVVAEYFHPLLKPCKEEIETKLGQYPKENSEAGVGDIPRIPPFKDIEAFFTGYIAPGFFSSNPICKEDSATYLLNLNATTNTSGNNFALRMFDSTGKLPDGVIEGTSGAMGNYDTCRAVDHSFSGQYCLLTTHINFAYFYMTGNEGLGSSVIMTPQAMVALSMGVQRGICVPDSCSSQDIVEGSKESYIQAFETHLNQTPLIPSIAYPSYCTAHNDPKLDSAEIAMAGVLIFLAVLIVLSTTLDIIMILYNKEVNGELMKLAISFSFYTNTKKLFVASLTPGTISCLNGIRFFSFTWVVIGHAYSDIFLLPSANVWALYEIISKFSYQAVMNATVSVDSFFFLSGLLVAYSLLKQLDYLTKNKGSSFVESVKMIKLVLLSYLHRYIRLTPVLIIIIGLSATLVRFIGDGPVHGVLVGTNMCHMCRETWWTVILYINNFVNLDVQCMGHTWYLANDMQFFLAAPLLLIPLHHSKTLGKLLFFISILTFTITTGWILYDKKLGPGTLLFGDGTVDMMDVMKYYYIKSYTRCGPYIVGLYLGCILHENKRKVIKMNWVSALVGWTVAFTAGMLIVYGLHDYSNLIKKMNDPENSPSYSMSVAVVYGALHRTVWAACLGWVVFACHYGYGGVINSILSWKVFIPLGRLTYCGYLLSYPLQAIVRAQQRVPLYITDYKMVYVILGDLSLTLICALIFSVCFESPFIAVGKFIIAKLSDRRS